MLQDLEARVSSEMQNHGSDHKGALQALESQVRKDMEALANDHSSNHGAAMTMLQQLDAKLHGEISNIHDEHDGAAQGHQNALASLEDMLRADMAKLSGDHSFNHGAALSMLQDLESRVSSEMQN